MTPTQATSSHRGTQPKFGVFTRTIVQGSVTRLLLAAQLSRSPVQHLISISDHSVRLQRFDPQDGLFNVITKTDFGPRIRSARIFELNRSVEIHPLIKAEDSSTQPKPVPSTQILILSLDSNEVLFLALECDGDQKPYFVTHSIPIPTFNRILFQPGEHLAVDPHSRAFAIAALDREIVVFTVKGDHSGNNSEWPPQVSQRSIAVEGVITHLDFLHPLENDPNHIILLIIVIQDRKSRAIWLEWYHGADIHEAQLHPGQPLETVRSMPSLVIPLRNAAFAIINEREAKVWKHLTTGSATCQPFEIVSNGPIQPGSTGRYPQWTSWARPKRLATVNRDTDNIYLAREDGSISFVQFGNDKISSRVATDTGCAIGSGFVALGNGWDDDVLAISGDMSTGRLFYIPQINTFSVDREDDLDEMSETHLIQTISNWASVTDMLPSDAVQAHTKPSRDSNSVFLTSSRQPYGAITELRKGFEAQLILYVELENLASMTDAWLVPSILGNSYLIVLSGPRTTKSFEMSTDGESMTELHAGTSFAFDPSHRTFLASSLSDESIVQVTEQSVHIYHHSEEGYNIRSRLVPKGMAILFCTIDPSLTKIIAGVKKDDGFALCCFQAFELYKLSSSDEEHDLWNFALFFKVTSEPIAASTSTSHDSQFVFVSTAEGRICAAICNPDNTMHIVDSIALPFSKDTPAVCDSMVCLQSADHSAIFLICGLRDGRVVSYTLRTFDPFSFRQQVPGVINLGKTSVKLSKLSQAMVCATSGSTTCALHWDGYSDTLSVDNIWTVDKLRPELSQALVTACVPVAPYKQIADGPLTGGLMLLTSDQLVFTKLQPDTSTVPRQIPVSGSPTRLIYMERQRCFACASICSEVRLYPGANSRSEPRRQIHPVIDFVPVKSTQPSCTYELQPGSKVYALLEWYISYTPDKVYSYLLVGSSYISKNGSEKGRVTMLQPMNRRWKVISVIEGHVSKFDEPVLALALYDDITYIACSGHHVYMHRFHADSKRWVALCQPYRLSSPGTQVKCSRGLISISTAADSLVMLHVHRNTSGHAELVPLQFAPKAALSLHHLIIDVKGEQIALFSDKHGQLTGLTVPSVPESFRGTSFPPPSGQILFEANLPQSLTRICSTHTRPSWKPVPSEEILNSNIIGSCADGAIIGIAVLRERLWQRLFWLQRLIEWHYDNTEQHGTRTRCAYKSSLTDNTISIEDEEDEEMNDVSDPDDDDDDYSSFANLRNYTPGLSKSTISSSLVLQSSRSEAGDMHIDGDVLARVFDGFGTPEEQLVTILRSMADRAGRPRANAVCRWIRDHLDAEMTCVPEVVAELKILLDAWF